MPGRAEVAGKGLLDAFKVYLRVLKTVRADDGDQVDEPAHMLAGGVFTFARVRIVGIEHS